MSTFILNITNLCNLRCMFCLDGDFKGRILNSSSEDAKERIREAARGGFKTIIFMGGETLVRTDFPDLVRLVRSLGIKPFVATNGLRLSDPSYLEELIDSGLAGIELSYHSHLREVANRLSGFQRTWEKQRKALGNLSAVVGDYSGGRRLSLIFNLVATELNYRRLSETARFLHQEFRFNPYVKFKFKALRLSGRASAHAHLLPRLSDAAPHVMEAARFVESRGGTPMIEMFPLCLVPGSEHRVLETRDRVMNHAYGAWDPQGGHHDGLDRYSGYSKGSVCKECDLAAICPGIWKEYADLHGVGELAAVRGSVDSIIRTIERERVWGWK